MIEGLDEWNAVLILKALLMAIPVHIGGRTYVLAEDNRLCVPGRNETTGEEVLLAVNFGDVTLQDFIGLATTATADEATAIAANIGLNELKGKRR